VYSEELKYPEDLLYSTGHTWVRPTEDHVRIGMTDYAQSMLGEIVFISLPEIGTELLAGQLLGELESIKAESDIESPVSGTVLKTNRVLEASPELMNDDPYGEGWMVDVQPSDYSELNDLLTPTAYQMSLKD
jgi:glycine cleavage system H protein